MKKLLLFVGLVLLGNIYALDTSCLLMKSQPINVVPGEVIQVQSSAEIYPLQ